MNKNVIIFITLVILWGFLFVRNSRAEAPLIDISVPLELQNNPIKKFAYNQVTLRWDESQWESFNNIIERESQWNHLNNNPHSSAKELGQLLDSTRKWLGLTYTTDPYIQVQHAIIYIDKVYGTPDKAWSVWQKQRWY